MIDAGTCRLCKDFYREVPLIKYSVRHYAHADCALKKWGAAFFDRLTPWQCAHQFPYMVAVKFGHEKALKARSAKDKS